ncbi:MAG: LbtU family siderophore porin [Gammaproteobacteria bacterium]|nr:MAG: LbtU family siderophore porin [Gammaproteobacteria bacterium]
MNFKYAGIAAIAVTALSPTTFAGDIKMPEMSYEGYIRVDGTFKNVEAANGTDTSSSDLKASKVWLKLDAKASEQVMGHAIFEWTGGDDDRVDVDEAVIVVKPKDTGLELTFGKHYLPVAAFNSSFMSDSQGVVLADIVEHAMTVGYTSGIATIQASIYNGAVQETGEDDDHIDGLVARLGLQLNDDLSVGASINSNIANSNTLSGSDGVNGGTIQSTVAGLSANISYAFAQFQLDAEYLTALDEFQVGELAFDGGTAYQPQVFTFEAKYDLGGDAYIAGRLETGEDGGDVIAENTYGIIYTTPLLDYLTFQAEFQRTEYETNDETDQLKLRIKYNF